MITSRTNKRVAAIRKLRGRRERQETGLFWAEGIRIVVEAARLGATIETLVVAPGLLRSQVAKDLVAAQRATGTPCLEVSADVFGSLSVKEGPQGLGAVVRQSWTALEQLMAAVTSGPAPLAAPARASGGTAPARTPEDPPLWVALDSIQDPGNLGTIIRTSDAAGGLGVILAGNTTDPYDPASVRASMGSLFAQRLARAGFDELLAWARRNGLAVVGTSGAAATAHSAPDCAATYRRPLVLLMGSEREGLSPERQAACDLVVKIPMVGRCESLNLAVATGIVLYEIRGRRGGAA